MLNLNYFDLEIKKKNGNTNINYTWDDFMNVTFFFASND